MKIQNTQVGSDSPRWQSKKIIYLTTHDSIIAMINCLYVIIFMRIIFWIKLTWKLLKYLTPLHTRTSKTERYTQIQGRLVSPSCTANLAWPLPPSNSMCGLLQLRSSIILAYEKSGTFYFNETGRNQSTKPHGKVGVEWNVRIFGCNEMSNHMLLAKGKKKSKMN